MKLDHIVSVSSFTAQSLMRELGIPANRITVVPNHVDSRFKVLGEAERLGLRDKWFGDVTHAVIHVGRPLSYKNRLGVIKAFLLLRTRLARSRLFLVGGACAPDEEALIQSENCSNDVIFVPPVSMQGLIEIYNVADALVFPSFHEGFGWPPLEAMACGCPVVSSTCASLREVVGNAALTVEDPNAHQAIADRLHDILSQPPLSRELVERGLLRASLFSEQRALRGMADVYESLA